MDFRLQGTVLRRQLQSMADLLPPSLQEGYMESCESLVEDPDPLIAAQEIQTVLREFLPPNILPEELIEVCMTCLEQYVRNKVQGSHREACSGVFWVNLGMLQIKVWTPQTIFDPAMKRSYKLIYAQQEVSTCLFLTSTENLHFLQQYEQKITTCNRDTVYSSIIHEHKYSPHKKLLYETAGTTTQLAAYTQDTLVFKLLRNAF